MSTQIHDVPPNGLADAVRAAHRAQFLRDVADGSAMPMVLPYSVLGAVVVPMLWLTIPHTRRPILYQTRWLVMAFIVVFNAHIIKCSSSTNMAVSYGVGLIAAWGTILNANLLIWTRPQFEAARAIRQLKKRAAEAGNDELRGKASNTATEKLHHRSNGLHNRRPDVDDGTGTVSLSPSASGEYVGENDYEFVWEAFPADASFWARLGWVADLTICFRGSGWNFAISSISRPEIPKNVRSGTLVNIQSIPKVSKSGYTRALTELEFVLGRLRNILLAYIIVDFLAIYMMCDPYFILGPNASFPLPPHLQNLSSWTLLAYREIFSIAGVLAAVQGVFNVSDLALHWLSQRFYPARTALWFYPSTFGSISVVLDRGLAGFWGAFWHQTFRLQFLAPSTYLLRRGFLSRSSKASSAVAMAVTFLQSGLMHTCGSLTTIPTTNWWRPTVFFLAQAAGVMIQDAVVTSLKARGLRAPGVVGRIANLVYTIGWLYLTAPLFIDDMATGGIWLLEPVPISPLRWLGLGGDGVDATSWDRHWWRWDREHFPKWYVGKHWWQSGVAF